MEIRKITEAERQESYYLGAQAFRNGTRDDDWASKQQQDPNQLDATVLGVWDDAGLQAKVVTIHFEQYFGADVLVRMGGVAGVACLPASRGKGYAAACLKVALEQMKERNEVVSTLFPFSWAFYRKLGWEWVGIQRNYEIPTRILPAFPETENVRAATRQDRDSIFSLYASFSRRYRGMVVRDLRLWNRRLDDTTEKYTFTYLYEHDGRVEGYLTYRGGEKKHTRIGEFITVTPRAQRGLLGLLRRHEMQNEAFKWSAPDNDTLWSQLYHWDIQTRLEPVTQARIVDVAGALRALKPDPGLQGAVTIALQDQVAPWNTGTWKLSCEGGHVEVASSQDDPDVELDIQALTQAYYGSPDVPMLRLGGRLVVHAERGYSLLNQLLSGPPMWQNDHF